MEVFIVIRRGTRRKRNLNAQTGQNGRKGQREMGMHMENLIKLTELTKLIRVIGVIRVGIRGIVGRVEVVGMNRRTLRRRIIKTSNPKYHYLVIIIKLQICIKQHSHWIPSI